MQTLNIASDITIRRVILAILVFGMVGLAPELLLLDHLKSPSQLIPFGLLLLMAIGVAWVYFKPSPASLRLFQALMVVVALGGLLGMWEHVMGNLQYVREINPDLGGLPLLWKALRKGAPVLAPGVMVQLALLGLAYTFRHPILRQASY